MERASKHSKCDSNNNATGQNSQKVTYDEKTSDTVDIQDILSSESLPDPGQNDLFDELSAASALIYPKDNDMSNQHRHKSSKTALDDKSSICSLPDSNAGLNQVNADTDAVSVCSEYGSSPVDRYDRFKNESPVSQCSTDDLYFRWKQCIKCKDSFFDFYTTPCSFCHGGICDECFHSCTYLQVIENHINVITVTEGGQLHPYAKLFLVCSESCENNLWAQLYSD